MLLECLADHCAAGWSKSAVKGPSAWNAKYARSDGETEPGSPSMSDGEALGDDDDVDYDDVRIACLVIPYGSY